MKILIFDPIAVILFCKYWSKIISNHAWFCWGIRLPFWWWQKLVFHQLNDPVTTCLPGLLLNWPVSCVSSNGFLYDDIWHHLFWPLLMRVYWKAMPSLSSYQQRTADFCDLHDASGHRRRLRIVVSRWRQVWPTRRRPTWKALKACWKNSSRQGSAMTGRHKFKAF